MDDLIKREDVNRIVEGILDDGSLEASPSIWMDLCRILKLPSAQPEVITCKDCIWWTKHKDSQQGRCARYGFYPTGYWYCAGAKERLE